MLGGCVVRARVLQRVELEVYVVHVVAEDTRVLAVLLTHDTPRVLAHLMHACVRVCMHACVYACMRGCMHVCVCACVRVCVCACVHVCMYACRSPSAPDTNHTSMNVCTVNGCTVNESTE